MDCRRLSAMPKYRTAPLRIATMPPGIPNIVGNEAAERFSFYGMKAILVVFMTKYLADSSGNLAVMGEPVVASLLAWALLAERPPTSAAIAAPLILAGAILALGERNPTHRGGV